MRGIAISLRVIREGLLRSVPPVNHVALQEKVFQPEGTARAELQRQGQASLILRVAWRSACLEHSETRGKVKGDKVR